ncbi:hypothetical protein D3C81_742570 [compost metagenome]
MKVYKDSLQDILKNCETVLGLNELVQNKSMVRMPIEEFFSELQKRNLREKSGTRDVNVSCSHLICSLCYTNSRCNFRRVSVLDFSSHTRIDILANLLLPFRKRENLTKDIKKNALSIMQYLDMLESKNKKFIGTMSYRYIRLFIVFLAVNDYAHASMVVEFLLDQIFLSESLDKAVKQKLKDLVDSKLAAKRMSKMYKTGEYYSNNEDNEEEHKMEDDISEEVNQKPLRKKKRKEKEENVEKNTKRSDKDPLVDMLKILERDTSTVEEAKEEEELKDNTNKESTNKKDSRDSVYFHNQFTQEMEPIDESQYDESKVKKSNIFGGND